MAETLSAGPCDRLKGETLACPQAALSILPRTAQFVLNGPAGARSMACESFGVALPTASCRATTQGLRAALWLGPDEALLIAPAEDSNDIAREIAATLKGLAASFVDVSHRNTMLALSGPQAAAVLNAGCPLDLEELVFPVGACTRTILAKAQIILWRTGSQDFTIAVWRSFAAYVWQFIDEARSALR